jgi:hypothetical protein
MGTSGDVAIAYFDPWGWGVPEVSIHNADGTQACQQLDFWSNGWVQTSCTLTQTGVHTVIVRDWKSDGGAYNVQICKTACADPSDPFSLTFDVRHPSADSPDPVDLASGDFVHSNTDLVIRGKGVPLEFTRYYHSKSTYRGPLGAAWTHNYDMFLRFRGSTIDVQYPEGHGRIQSVRKQLCSESRDLRHPRRQWKRHLYTDHRYGHQVHV